MLDFMHDFQAKPIYGGWLCLAPVGTDFDNPMQRSRVRHDETELKYTHAFSSSLLLLFPQEKWCRGDFVVVVFQCQKWQRRFFILYEDGSLRFALDELVRCPNKNIHDVAVYSIACSVYASAFIVCWEQAGIFRPDVACGPQQMIWA